MLTGPTFTTVPSRSRGGDFLGMGLIGERLYGKVFPGLNNNVRHVRAYAAICWVIHNLHKRAFASGEANIGELRERTVRGIWKMQLLLNWVAKLDRLQGYPGVPRFANDPGKVVLEKDSWPNVKISFWGTAWYRPGLLNGMHFLKELEDYRGTYKCTPAGTVLAEAYESVVQDLDPKLRRWLADPDALGCTKARLNVLRPVLKLTRPSKAEQEAFLRQFYMAEYVTASERGQLSKRGASRRKGLLLTLRTLDALQAEGADRTVEAIRHAMAAGVTPGGHPIDVAGLETVQLQWSVLQVRLLLRMAMETLLGLVERHILEAERAGRARQKEEIVDAIAAFCKPTKESELYATVQENYDWAKQEQGTYPTLQAAGLTTDNEYLGFSALKADVRSGASADPKGWFDNTQQAIWVVLVCAIEAENLMTRPGAKALLGEDPGKVSLCEMLAALNVYKARSTEDFTRHVVEKFVIGQHLVTAVERSVVAQDGKSRFVFTPEKDGLTRYAEVGAEKFVKATESDDILFHALLLLENCGKLSYTPTKDGPNHTNNRQATFGLKNSARKLLQVAP